MTLLRLSILTLAAGALAACGSEVTPQGLAPAPWFTIGKGPAGYTSVDTARVAAEGSQRVLWVRTDYLDPDSAPASPGGVVKVRETQHRVNCGARTVADLAMVFRDSAGAELGGAAVPAGAPVAFDAHPYGKGVFPTVCNALTIADGHRRRGR